MKWQLIPSTPYCLNENVPVYEQKLKVVKQVRPICKRWRTEAIDMVLDCLNTTDWDSPQASYGSDCSCISFCEQSCIPTRTVVKYNTASTGLQKHSGYSGRSKSVPIERWHERNTGMPDKSWIKPLEQQKPSTTSDSSLVWRSWKNKLDRLYKENTTDCPILYIGELSKYLYP